MAQSVHAAFQIAVEYPSTIKHWHQTSNYLVIVAAPNEAALAQLAGRATEEGIVRAITREPDMDNQICAVALQPGAEARRLCANYPLALRKREERLVPT